MDPGWIGISDGSSSDIVLVPKIRQNFVGHQGTHNRFSGFALEVIIFRTGVGYAGLIKIDFVLIVVINDSVAIVTLFKWFFTVKFNKR